MAFQALRLQLSVLFFRAWRKQEVRKSQNQGLRTDPAWSINYRKIESRTEDFPGLWVAASCCGLKGPEIMFPSAVQTFHRSDSSLLTRLVDVRLPLVWGYRILAAYWKDATTPLEDHGSTHNVWSETWQNYVLALLATLLNLCNRGGMKSFTMGKGRNVSKKVGSHWPKRNLEKSKEKKWKSGRRESQRKPLA